MVNGIFNFFVCSKSTRISKSQKPNSNTPVSHLSNTINQSRNSSKVWKNKSKMQLEGSLLKQPRISQSFSQSRSVNSWLAISKLAAWRKYVHLSKYTKRRMKEKLVTNMNYFYIWKILISRQLKTLFWQKLVSTNSMTQLRAYLKELFLISPKQILNIRRRYIKAMFSISSR